MKTARIVIDLGFGDSGKGKITDYLCSTFSPDDNPIVVRFSGGQQCGHHVKNPLGDHIHASWPSGSLRGLDGYISEHCTISPQHLYTEAYILYDKIGPTYPKLYIHPLAKVTTPWDIHVNKKTEIENNHGSCGMGVGATMKRHIETPYKFHAIDLFNDFVLEERIQSFVHAFGDRPDLVQFRNYIKEFRKLVTIAGYEVLNGRHVIFEGSQGILLDMDHGIFPHVTYANTTSKNAWEIIAKFPKCGFTEVNYVTRSYLTRHGNGPMPNEDPNLKLKNTDAETNKTNRWQGDLRFAKHDPETLDFALKVDMAYHPHETKRVLNITCLDQFDGFPIEIETLFSTCRKFACVGNS